MISVADIVYSCFLVISAWAQTVDEWTKLWVTFYSSWISSAKERDTIVMFYSDLQNDLERSLINLAFFLGVNITSSMLKCSIEQHEGKFHRSKFKMLRDPFKGILINKTKVTEGQRQVKLLVEECLSQDLCVSGGCGYMNLHL